MRDPGEQGAFFWDLAAGFLALPDTEEGTLMGFPCLRASGAFFAMCDHRSGDLIVKLAATRVDDLIGQGIGMPFAPAGRVFKEWVRVPLRDETRWEALMAEGRTFVAGPDPIP